MSPDPYELELELAIAREELAALPSDAFQERITARQRILALEADLAAATPIPVGSLTEELARLRETHRRLRSARLDPSNANGGLGMGGGIDPNFLHRANRRIDELTGIAAIEARIREIERLLGDADREPPTANRMR